MITKTIIRLGITSTISIAISIISYHYDDYQYHYDSGMTMTISNCKVQSAMTI